MSALIHDRLAMRRIAAVICGAIAALYLAIAAGATSIESTDEINVVVFGVGAASIFVIGAALLLRFDRRLLWATGAVLQLMIAAMYLAVSSDRAPAFEAWGLGLRVLQIPLLGLLVLLALRPVRPVRPVEDLGERGAPTSSPMTSAVPSVGSPTSSGES